MNIALGYFHLCDDPTVASLSPTSTYCLSCRERLKPKILYTEARYNIDVPENNHLEQSSYTWTSDYTKSEH
jgi:hypothetical protein